MAVLRLRGAAKVQKEHVISSGARDYETLESAISGPEHILASGRHLVIDYPDGFGRSKLTTVLIERKLDIRGTARNWNTVLKISAMARAS